MTTETRLVKNLSDEIDRLRTLNAKLVKALENVEEIAWNNPSGVCNPDDHDDHDDEFNLFDPSPDDANYDNASRQVAICRRAIALIKEVGDAK